MADDAVRARAHTLLVRGAHQEAAAQFGRIAVPTPDDHAHRAQALTAAGRLPAAAAALRSAIALAPDAADLHGCLGQVLAQSGERVAAIAALRQALALDPGHWAAGELVAVRGQISERVHSWHLPMLADTARNAAFAAAIAAAVRPDDVVLDIGTGTGLLAMMAARAGARHVYACEMLPDLAALARIVVAENGFAGRITIIAKPSTALAIGTDLPERATLLVTETFDALLTGEGALPALNHAHAELLTPDARVVPCGGRIMGQLVTFARLKAMHPLQSVCGFDLRGFAAHALEKQFYPILPDHEQLTHLSAPAEIIAFDLARPNATERQWTLPIAAAAAGVVQALVLWIDLHLDASTTLSTGPGGTARHWTPVAFLFDAERTVTEGETVMVQCRMGAGVLHFSL